MEGNPQESQPIVNPSGAQSNLNSQASISTSQLPNISATQTPQVNGEDQKAGGIGPKLKYVIYFFLGLVLSILGLLVGIVWIFAKEKQTKIRFLIALLLGVTLSVVFWFIVSGGITIGNGTTLTKGATQQGNIEERMILADLSRLYPNLSFKVLIGEHNPPLTFGNTTISTFVTIGLSSSGAITLEQIDKVGKQVCATLERLELSVSQVQVEAASSRGMGGTCKEWESGEVYNTLKSTQP